MVDYVDCLLRIFVYFCLVRFVVLGGVLWFYDSCLEVYFLLVVVCLLVFYELFWGYGYLVYIGIVKYKKE